MTQVKEMAMLDFPRISLVIPNFNCGDFLEATILSIIEQGYPELELIMVDGASTDNSAEIIKKYSSHFSKIIIEPDTGQGDALNKGFRHATGEIMGWINSDDILLPRSLEIIANVFDQHLNIGWITGDINLIDEAGNITKSTPSRSHTRIRFSCGDFRWIQQESTFWRNDLWDAAGGRIDDSVKLAIDAELWLRFFEHERLYTVRAPLGAFRIRRGQRSEKLEEYYAEVISAIHKHRERMSEAFKSYFRSVLESDVVVRSKEEAEKLGSRITDMDIKPVTRDPEHDMRFINPNPKLHPSITRMKRVPKKKHFKDIHEILYGSVDRKGADDLKRFKDIHAGKRCVIMGNGPSLNKMDLNVFSNEIVFAANSVFLLFDKVKWRPRYYACVDTRVLPDIADEIMSMRRDNPEMNLFFPKMLSVYDGTGTKLDSRKLIPPNRQTHYFTQQNMNKEYLPHSAFSLDADAFLCTPNTVTISLMQLAYYMGFSQIYLIGCDTSYSVKETVKQDGPKANDGNKLFLTSTEDDDDNHFDPRYFGKGRKWHSPNVPDMIFHYYQAAIMLEEAGCQVFNATVGGNLEVFPRVDYNDVFGMSSGQAKPL